MERWPWPMLNLWSSDDIGDNIGEEVRGLKAWGRAVAPLLGFYVDMDVLTLTQMVLPSCSRREGEGEVAWMRRFLERGADFFEGGAAEVSYKSRALAAVARASAEEGCVFWSGMRYTFDVARIAQLSGHSGPSGPSGRATPKPRAPGVPRASLAREYEAAKTRLAAARAAVRALSEAETALASAREAYWRACVAPLWPLVERVGEMREEARLLARSDPRRERLGGELVLRVAALVALIRPLPRFRARGAGSAGSWNEALLDHVRGKLSTRPSTFPRPSEADIAECIAECVDYDADIVRKRRGPKRARV